MSNESEFNLTAEQKDALQNLRDQRQAKFAQIIALLSRASGPGNPETLDPHVHKRISDEARSAINHWMEQAEMDRRESSTSLPPTPLQRLLNEHYELGEQQRDILDEAADHN
jgi:hypothetical protein